jgi:hypothetical protein
VTAICHQTGVSRFDVHQIIDGREAAVTKTARVHFIRSIGWPEQAFREAGAAPAVRS